MQLDKFNQHLQTLTPTDWNRLFTLLPQIEKTENFGELIPPKTTGHGFITMPYHTSAAIVNTTFEVIEELQLMPIFDWTSWKAGGEMLNDNHFDYDQLDTITLCQLFTTISRADRFTEGFKVACFENGAVAKIIRGLQQNLSSKY